MEPDSNEVLLVGDAPEANPESEPDEKTRILVCGAGLGSVSVAGVMSRLEQLFIEDSATRDVVVFITTETVPEMDRYGRISLSRKPLTADENGVSKAISRLLRQSPLTEVLPNETPSFHRIRKETLASQISKFGAPRHRASAVLRQSVRRNTGRKRG